MRKGLLRRFGVFVLLITILIGVSGCMKKPEDYKKDILSYLEAKYDEEFVVDSMRKEVGIGTSDLIRAECYSKRYPGIKFTVQYQLDFNDVHNEDEIVDLLEQADSISKESLKEWEQEVEPYLEDDYANILYQNEFDERIEGKVDIQQNYLIKSVFTTPNHFPNQKESMVGLNDYMGSENYDLVSYHFVFLEEQGNTIDSKLDLINKVTNSLAQTNTSMQFIAFYFITNYSVENIKRKFLDNYDDPNEYFSKQNSTVSSGVVTIDKGKLQDSNEEILKMLEGK